MKAATSHPDQKGHVCIDDADMPSLVNDSDVILQITHSALNRADLLQCRGLYPAPAGETQILGLEAAGTIVELGAAATKVGWRLNDQVMALLPGGGQAEFVRVHCGSLLPTPPNFTDVEAGAFMETYMTAYLNLFELAHASNKSDRPLRILIHGGSGGVGGAALALLQAEQNDRSLPELWATAGDDMRCARVKSLGAHRVINYRAQDFAAEAKSDGVKFDIVLDCIGGSYLNRHMSVLAHDARLVVIGLMGGTKAELNMATLVQKRVHIMGSTLRPLKTAHKAQIISRFKHRFSTALHANILKPIVERSFKLPDINAAHACMKAGDYFGKISIEIEPG